MEAAARLQEAAAHKKCWSCGCFHNSLVLARACSSRSRVSLARTLKRDISAPAWSGVSKGRSGKAGLGEQQTVGISGDILHPWK